jgi:hypothetical protein
MKKILNKVYQFKILYHSFEHFNLKVYVYDSLYNIVYKREPEFRNHE